MTHIAMLPQPMEGERRYYGDDPKDVRVIGLVIDDEGVDRWLVLHRDGRPEWAEFDMVTM